MMARVNKPITIPAPETVTIGGKTLRVIIDQATTSGRGRDGYMDPMTETIGIAPHLPGPWKSSTLIHEIMEAINTIWLAEKMDHDDIDRLGEAFYQAMTSMGIEIDWSV